jgi:FkbH-like protein
MSTNGSPLNNKQKIKCVVWDLDNTLWEGILLEDDKVTLRSGVVDIIRTLDSRGILQSIASRNEHTLAMLKLEEFGLNEYFINPQINWNSKSSSIQAIAAAINIGIDSLAFIDDQPFELDEVQFTHPQVLCLDAAALDELLDMPQMMPRFITEDSANRRHMYLRDLERKQVEDNFVGTQEEFLASLNMKFSISRVGEGDLERAEELTVRTHQLNATGYTYSYEEMDALRKSDKHLLFIASLEDKYGDYGKIGLTLIELEDTVWTVKLLLMSCRVMSRGVGSVLMNHIMHLAHEAKVTLRAEFVSTDRNRMMYITYKFAGFQEIHQDGDFIIFENDLRTIQPLPEYISLHVEELTPSKA